MYMQDYDESYLPSVNYGVSTDNPLRIWTNMIQPYVKNEGIMLCASASGGKFAANGSLHGEAPIGYTTLTGFDPVNPPDALEAQAP